MNRIDEKEIWNRAAKCLPDFIKLKEINKKHLIRKFDSFEHLIDTHKIELVFHNLVSIIFFDPLELVYYQESVWPQRVDKMSIYLIPFTIVDKYGESLKLREERYQQIKRWWPSRYEPTEIYKSKKKRPCKN